MLTTLLFTLAAAVFAQAQGSMQAPESVLAVAGSDPMTFAAILAHIGVPAGLEIHHSSYEDYTHRSSRWDPQQWTSERLASQRSVPIARVVTAFNSRHVGYQAIIMNGVFVIRPTERRTAYLDSRGPTGQLYVRGLEKMAEKVFAPIDPTLGRGGRAVSRLEPAGIDIDYGDSLDLVVDTWDKPVLDVLNDIVRQASGHSWVVVTSDDAVAVVEAFGFLHRYGTGAIQSIHR